MPELNVVAESIVDDDEQPTADVGAGATLPAFTGIGRDEYELS
jgi:hypothetical protein